MLYLNIYEFKGIFVINPNEYLKRSKTTTKKKILDHDLVVVVEVYI